MGGARDGLDLCVGVRRAARQQVKNTAARAWNDCAPLDRRPHDEYRFSNGKRLEWRARGAAEMNAQVAMSVLVHAIGEAVRRIGVQPDDERDGRDESDQTIAAKTRAQGETYLLNEPKAAEDMTQTSRPSLHAARAQAPALIPQA